MTRLRIALALVGWTAAVTGVLSRLLEDELPPSLPCNDVIVRVVKASCIVQAPEGVPWTHDAYAVAVWALGIAAGFIAIQLSRRGRRSLTAR